MAHGCQIGRRHSVMRPEERALSTPNPGRAGNGQAVVAPPGTAGQPAPGDSAEVTPETAAGSTPRLTSAQLQAEAAQKARKLDEARQTEQTAFLGHIRREIQDSGFDYDTVVYALARPGRNPAKGAPAQPRRWQLRSNRACTYCGRGHLPHCVMEATRARGYDPVSRLDRKRFIEEFMEPAGCEGLPVEALMRCGGDRSCSSE